MDAARGRGAARAGRRRRGRVCVRASCGLLEDDGFHVVGQAGDAEELLGVTTELLPDVVITDIRMPPDFQLEGLAAAR